MYREAIAVGLQRLRSDTEVMLVPEEGLDGQVDGFRPQVLVRNDSDGAIPEGLLGQYGLDKENNRFAKGFGRLRPDTMARVFDPKLGHLPFDDARIAAIASRGQGPRGHVG